MSVLIVNLGGGSASTDTAPATYTPTFTGFGTVVTQTFRWSLIAPKLLMIQGRWTSGTTTGTEARITLPAGFTSSSSILTLEIAGDMVRSDTGEQSCYALIEANVTYMTFSQQDAGNGALTKRNGSDLGTAQAMALVAFIPVA